MCIIGLCLLQEANFEDPYGDDFEEEEFTYDENEDNEEMEENSMNEKLIEENEEELPIRSWRPGIDPINDGTELFV